MALAKSAAWMRASLLRQARYREILRADPALASDIYLGRIERRMRAVGTLRASLFVLHLLILGILATSLVPNVAAEIRFREVLIVCSALLSAMIGFISYHHDVLADITAVVVEYRSAGNKDVEEMLRISHGLIILPLPAKIQEHFEIGSGYFLLVKLLIPVAGLILAIATLATIYIRVNALRSIYTTPSFSTSVSVCVIVFALLCDVLALLVFLTNAGPVWTRKTRHQTNPQCL